MTSKVSKANMANQFSTVIVFGPTGDVGGAAALEASKRGAKVWLAMRNLDKSIKAITKEQEQQGSFHRIQADLSDADSVKQAVQQSGAKAAFIYFTPGIEGSIQAMKDAGIEYVVFLSSFSLEADHPLRQIPPSEFIPYVHAQVEIALEDAGIAHTSLRPAQFASNGLKMNTDQSKSPWEAKVAFARLRSDCIAPNDIGRVGGAVLVNRPSSAAKDVIYLCGPQLLTADEQFDIIMRVSGKKIEVVHQNHEDYTKYMIGKGIPPPVVKYLVEFMAKADNESIYPDYLYKEGLANIKKYSGYEPTSFEEYVSSQNLG